MHLFNTCKEGLFKFHYLDCDINGYSWSKVPAPIVYFDFSEEQFIFLIAEPIDLILVIDLFLGHSQFSNVSELRIWNKCTPSASL